MLNKDQMSLQDFQTWKEANSFLFDHLKELKSTLDDQVTEYAKTVLICSTHDLENLRLRTAALAGQATILEDLINLEYLDIVDDSEEKYK